MASGFEKCRAEIWDMKWSKAQKIQNGKKAALGRYRQKGKICQKEHMRKKRKAGRPDRQTLKRTEMVTENSI